MDAPEFKLRSAISNLETASALLKDIKHSMAAMLIDKQISDLRLKLEKMANG